MQFNEAQAIYLQIADFIEEKILRKEWKPDERIPSVRDLAMSMQVNPNTVVRTFDSLQQKGIIFNKRGIGYFVADGAEKLVKSDHRMRFVKQELPKLFKNMQLLDFSIEEIAVLYQSFISDDK